MELEKSQFRRICACVKTHNEKNTVVLSLGKLEYQECVEQTGCNFHIFQICEGL
jgi:hypothetical protein